jgi:hypothetical protein
VAIAQTSAKVQRFTLIPAVVTVKMNTKPWNYSDRVFHYRVQVKYFNDGKTIALFLSDAALNSERALISLSFPGFAHMCF